MWKLLIFEKWNENEIKVKNALYFLFKGFPKSVLCFPKGYIIDKKAEKHYSRSGHHAKYFIVLVLF